MLSQVRTSTPFECCPAEARVTLLRAFARGWEIRFPTTAPHTHHNPSQSLHNAYHTFTSVTSDGPFSTHFFSAPKASLGFSNLYALPSSAIEIPRRPGPHWGLSLPGSHTTCVNAARAARSLAQSIRCGGSLDACRRWSSQNGVPQQFGGQWGNGNVGDPPPPLTHTRAGGFFTRLLPTHCRGAPTLGVPRALTAQSSSVGCVTRSVVVKWKPCYGGTPAPPPCPSNTGRWFREFSHRGFWRCMFQLVLLCATCAV